MGFRDAPDIPQKGSGNFLQEWKIERLSIGQLKSVLRGLNDAEQGADILQRLAAARGAINSLMAEPLEDHIRNHMPKNSQSAEEAAEDVVAIVKTYLR